MRPPFAWVDALSTLRRVYQSEVGVALPLGQPGFLMSDAPALQQRRSPNRRGVGDLGLRALATLSASPAAPRLAIHSPPRFQKPKETRSPKKTHTAGVLSRSFPH